MLKNYFKIALRNLKRHRGYAFFNITGLAIGIACCLLLLLYVRDELSYDRFHEKADHIYRLIEVGTFNEIKETSAGIPFPVAPALRNEFPEITTTRFFRMQSQVPLVSHDEKRFYEERFFWTDSSVFDVFSFAFLQGDPSTALDDPYALLITEATAKKYFGTSDVVGRILTLEGKHAYTITGVLENLPHNVHFTFDFLASFESLNQVLPSVGVPEDWFTGWYWNPCITYVRLPDEYDARRLEDQLPAFVNKYYPDWFKADIDYYTMGLVLVAGRGFSAADTADTYLLNETAAERLGWTDPIGKRLGIGDGKDDLDGRVIGVVSDFNFASLRQRVEPLVIRFDPGLFSHMLVRVKSNDVPGGLAALEAVWKQFEPQRPFEFTFLDQSLRGLYTNEHTLKTILLPFAFIAIFVACLGLFGLAAFTTEQRTKEVGIRKVFGASVASVVALLSKDFLKLVGTAFIIATPMAYFAIQQWLDGFAYRIEIGAGTFLLAGAFALLIALGTVSYRTVKAALENPIKSLRYE